MPKQILISILLSYVVDLVAFFFGSFSAKKNIYADWTLYWMWVIISLIGVVLIFRFLRVNLKRALIISALASLLTISIWYPLLSSESVIKHGFLGLEYRASPKSDKDAIKGAAPEFSFLYRSNDPELKRLMEELKTKNELVNARGFFFWQTGIAYGFGQRFLPKFYEIEGHRVYHAALILTVGPVVILESLINGAIKTAALFLLLQIGWHSIRKRLLLTRP